MLHLNSVSIGPQLLDPGLLLRPKAWGTKCVAWLWGNHPLALGRQLHLGTVLFGGLGDTTSDPVFRRSEPLQHCLLGHKEI